MLYVNDVCRRIYAITGLNGADCMEEQDIRQLPENLIWDAFRMGNEKAFTWLYSTYSTLLFEYGCRLAGDKELVGDCLQDFYLYLREGRSRFGETNAIKPYLLRAFRRRIFEYIRKNQVQVSIDVMTNAVQSAEPSIESSRIYKEMKSAQLEKLNKALKMLKPVQREAIYYFYYKGLGYEKIAEIFNFSHVSSARRVMYRSLKQLRDSFQYSSY